MISNKEIRLLITKDLHKELRRESFAGVIGWIALEINNCSDLFALGGRFVRPDYVAEKLSLMILLPLLTLFLQLNC